MEWARLFPIETETSAVATFSNLRLAEFSSNRKYLFTIEHNATVGEYSSLQGEKINSQKVSLHEALGDNSERILEGAIELVAWNESCNKILVTWTRDDKTTWHLIDLENTDKSTNLNKKFGMTFTDVRISNDSASKLWALENGNIHIIDISNQTISGVLVSDVEQFTNNKDVISYISLNDENHNHRKINIFKEGEKGSTTIFELEENKPSITISMGTYWSESWVAFSINNHLIVYSGKYPSFDRPIKNSLKEILNQNLEYTPNLSSTNQLGRIAIFAGNANITSVDIETRNHFNTTTEKEITKLNRLDDYLIWEIVDDKAIIRDFDGDNRREILNVNNSHPINITEDNHWLYFFETKEADIDKDGKVKEATEDTAPADTIYTLKRQKLN